MECMDVVEWTSAALLLVLHALCTNAKEVLKLVRHDYSHRDAIDAPVDDGVPQTCAISNYRAYDVWSIPFRRGLRCPMYTKGALVQLSKLTMRNWARTTLYIAVFIYVLYRVTP